MAKKTRPFVVEEGVLVIPKGTTKRVTLLIREELDLNLELYCTTLGLSKKDVMAKALAQFLHSEGIPDPLVTPRIEWK
jgi:hypothetical protein